MMIEEKFVTLGKYRIRYLEAGKGPRTILLLHGLGGSADRWRQTIPYLSKDHRIIAPDIIGFGHSDKPVVKYTVDFFNDFLSSFLQSLDINQLVMIGSSLGGQITAEFAIEKKKPVEKMILVSPSGINNHSTPALDAYIQAVLHPSIEDTKRAFQMMAGSNKNIDSDTINGFIEHMDLPNAKMSFMSALMELRKTELTPAKLAKISIPTMVIWGSQDQVIPIRNAELFVSSIRGCHYLEIKRCGHTPYVEEPLKFAKAVIRFLEQ